jgi:LacI family transcriptional regulator
VIVETENASGRSILRGIGRYARERRECEINYVRPDSTTERGWVDELRQWKAGAIVARVDNPLLAEALRETGLPVVDVAGQLDSGFPTVSLDNEAIGVVAAEHLLELGFRRLAFLGFPDLPWVEGRLRGVRRAARAVGITPLVHFCSAWPVAPWAHLPPREQLRTWLRTLPRPIGVVACSDIWGGAVLAEAARSGTVVPEYVAVVGVDNDDLMCECTSPTMSSVIANHFAVGYEAAAVAAKLVLGLQVPRKIMVEPQGVAARASTDVIAIDEPSVSAALHFIRKKACHGIGVEDVVDAVPVSRSVLQRKFQAVLGRSIHDLIVEARIKRAKELLASTDLPIAIVAERAGIEPQPYLNVVFKARVGESPARYRKRTRHVSDLERLA